MLKRLTYASLGAVLGVLVNSLGFWADTSNRQSQEMLGAKTLVRSAIPSVQSMVLSIGTIVVLALMCAFLVAVVARKKLA